MKVDFLARSRLGVVGSLYMVRAHKVEGTIVTLQMLLVHLTSTRTSILRQHEEIRVKSRPAQDWR